MSNQTPNGCSEMLHSIAGVRNRCICKRWSLSVKWGFKKCVRSQNHEHFRSYYLLWGCPICCKHPWSLLLQKCHISSHTLCTGGTHFYKLPSAGKDVFKCQYLLSYFLIFLLFLFSFYQYSPVNLMFHGLLEIHIHQLRTGVLWSLQHFSNLFKGLVLNSCTGDKFLLHVAIQMCDISSRQAVACFAVLAAGRACWWCIQERDSIVPKLILGTGPQQQQLQGCSRTDLRAGLRLCHSWLHLGLLDVFSPWHFSSPVRANLEADQWAMGKWK